MKNQEFIKKLEKRFKSSEPIFIQEIYQTLNQYSRQTVFNMINQAINDGYLKKCTKGTYFLSQEEDAEKPVINQIVEKKYIKDGDKVFGIYGRIFLDHDFGVSTQIPQGFEIITNNASRELRWTTINGRQILLRKSRCHIDKDNQYAYSLLEFFNHLLMYEYEENPEAERLITNYIQKNKINRKQVLSLAEYFPAKALKNMTLTGIIYELA